MNLRIALLLLLLAPIPSSADEFEDLRARYREKRLEIDVEAKNGKTIMLGKYAAAVEAVSEKLQSGGNLNGVIAAKREIDAARAGSLAETEVETLATDLQKYRNLAEAEIEKIGEKQKEDLAELNRRYTEGLENVKVAFTKQGSVEAAVEVQKEIEKVKRESAALLSRVQEFSDLPPSLRRELTAWFTFDESEGTVLTDLSPNQLTATMLGTQFVEKGRVRGARSFDGETDRMALYKQIPDSRDFTIAVWVKFGGEPGKGGIFSDWDGRNANDLYFALIGNQAIHFRADKSGDTLRAVMELPKPLSSDWHHIAWTLSSSKSTIYVDGKPVGNHQGKGGNIGHHGAWIGMSSDGTQMSYFKGQLDELMLWHRDLSDNEIREVWELGSR